MVELDKEAKQYTLEDIKLIGYKPQMGIELDDRLYEVEVDLSKEYSTKIAKITAHYYEYGECYEVENWSKLEKLYDIFMDRCENKKEDE